MNVPLTPEQERLIQEALSSGRYRSATEVLDEALHDLAGKRRPAAPSRAERQQAIERLRTFGRRRGLSLGEGVTIKDLINEGRR